MFQQGSARKTGFYSHQRVFTRKNRATAAAGTSATVGSPPHLRQIHVAQHQLHLQARAGTHVPQSRRISLQNTTLPNVAAASYITV
jgi:hypothetical protein